MRSIDSLRAPLFVSWQLTQGCNLACMHCCSDSAPGRRAGRELGRGEALRLAADIVRSEVPYVMLAGGEPLIVPHFLDIAEHLGRAGVQLKIETNGQLLARTHVDRLAKLPIRSIQISLDGATQEAYGKQRVGGELFSAHAACRAVRAAGLPLEVAFAPSRMNIHEAEAVIDRAEAYGAFRFNTGRLMRMGTASRYWERIAPSEDQYSAFRAMLERKRTELAGRMDLCYLPFSILEGLREALADPPATLLVLPDGKVKISAPLPFTCADLRKQTLGEAWEAYRRAWKNPRFQVAAEMLVADPLRLAQANLYVALEMGRVADPVLVG